MNNRLEAGGGKPAMLMMGTRALAPTSLRAPPRVACVRKRHSLGGRLVAGVLQKGKENMSVLKYIEHVFSAMDSKEAVGLGGSVEESGDQGLSEEASEGTVTVLPLPLASSLAASTLLPEVQQDDVYRTIALLEKKNEDMKVQMEEMVSLMSATLRTLRSATQPESNGHTNGMSSASGPTNGVLLSNGSGGWPNTGSLAVEDEFQLSGPTVIEQPAVSACVVQHPGALCCTKTSIAQDPDNKVCMLTFRTVARVTKESAVADVDDLVALASQALAASATEFCRSKTQRWDTAIHTQERLQLHQEISHILQVGKIVSAKRNDPSQFGHESFLVELKDPVSNRRIQALFKPRVKGDSDGWHRVPIEWVAYKLNLMLGMDYVPPVGYRTGGVDVDYTRFEEGAFIYFCPGARLLKKHPYDQWGVARDIMLSDTRILDVLLHNSDRHHGHFLMGQHWVQGRWEGGDWRGAPQPILIDHAAGFRREAVVTMEHENAFQTGAARCVSATTYLRLRFLDAAAIATNFRSVLSEREMREMLVRRNAVLKYLDQLVAEQGYNNTVVDGPVAIENSGGL